MKIGLRIPGACARLPLEEFAIWCRNAGFHAVDLSRPDVADAETVRAAGLEIGTVDLGSTQKLLSPDGETRRAGADECIRAIHAIAEIGVERAFFVLFPADPRQSRRDSFAYWRESFPAVAEEAERGGVRLALEGWPGPNNSAIGVTPEQLRAMFAVVPSDWFGINFDPSHFVRIGVAYQRALVEFGSRVIHVHGKDTAIDANGAYVYGNLGPTFDPVVGFGGGDWRYCIPGEGTVDWATVCGSLARLGFDGIVSIELEDFRYNGTADGEKHGLLRAREHLLRYL
jgi:sugar phosphate isomerase/epimerase